MWALKKLFFTKKNLTSKLLNQGYKSDRLKVVIKMFCGRYTNSSYWPFQSIRIHRIDEFIVLTFLAYLVNLSHSLLMIYYKFLYRLWPKPWIWPNLDYDSILWKFDCDLEYDIYLFRHMQVMGGTSAAGNAHQIRSTWFHLPPFWLADSLCNVVSAPFCISAPFGLVWKFSVGMHGVTYLVVIQLVFTFYISVWYVFVSVIILAWVGSQIAHCRWPIGGPPAATPAIRWRHAPSAWPADSRPTDGCKCCRWSDGLSTCVFKSHS